MERIATERDIARIALFAALIAALGLVPPITVPLAGGVPVTAQTLGVMLAGLVLGPWRGALACLVVVAVVALGAPILSGGRGGLGVFAGPTVGFLVGWPVAALATGLLQRWLKRLGGPLGSPMMAGFLAATFGGIVVLYVIGVGVLYAKIGSPAIPGSLIFIPGDLLKAALAALIARELRRARPSLIDE